MKEKDAEASPSPRYMSPIVKQDLARLDKDTESRRSAMNSLKHFVENLDPGSMPRFLAQVSEIRDQGASKTHAISLYEEVARVHGKLIIPHIPRVMATVTRSLSSSGSSPQLHQACAKVVSAVARYSIDDSSILQADEIIRELCDPLLEVLAGKLEPLASGAAVCLQALVESGKWGNASDELVNEACLRTAVAMGEKGTRTVAHMQLTCALASANPTFMGAYGVSLLRAGVDILRLTSASSTWQQRACAARLIQVVLPIADRATISSELGPTIQALESCKHDRMPHVRTAVSEALKTAKVLLLEDNSRRIGDGMDPMGIPPLNFFSEHDKHFNKASRRKSLFAVSEMHMPYASTRRASCCAPLCFSQVSQESQIVSFPPSLSSESSTPSFVSPPPPGRSRRTPLFPTRTPHKCSSQASSVSSGETFDGYFHSDRLSEAPAKENVPARNPDVNAGVPWDIGMISGGSPWSGRVGKYVRPRPPTPGSHIPYPPSLSDKLGTDQQSRDIDASPVAMSKGRQGRAFSPLEDSTLTSSRDQEGDAMAQDEEVFSNGGTAHDIEAESDTSSSRESIHSVSSRISAQSEQSTISQVKIGRESLGPFSVSGSVHSRIVLSGPTMKNVFELKRPVPASIAKSIDQPVRPAADEVILPPHDFPGNDCKDTMDALCNLRAHYNSMAHLRSMEDPCTPEKPKALITAEDFLPYSTPRRLVRSLQSTLSSPDSGSGSVGDQDVKSTGEVDMGDMDLETSSEAGWSVRDNPIASDDSFKTDSDEEDSGRKVCKKMTADLNRDTTPALSESNHSSSELRITEPVSGLALEPTGVDKSSSLKDERVTKPEEDVEIIKRTQQEAISSSYSQSLGGLRSLLAEDCTYDCTCSGKDYELKQQSDGGGISKDGHDADMTSPRGLFREKMSMVVSSRLGYLVSKSWRSIRAYAEVFLGGSLLVVLALPFAMAMSKVFLSRPELPGLVPT